MFSVGPLLRLYYKTNGTSQSVKCLRESLEVAVTSYERDLSEVFVPGGGWEGECCKSLHSNAKSSCKIDASQKGIGRH